MMSDDTLLDDLHRNHLAMGCGKRESIYSRATAAIERLKRKLFCVENSQTAELAAAKDEIERLTQQRASIMQVVNSVFQGDASTPPILPDYVLSGQDKVDAIARLARDYAKLRVELAHERTENEKRIYEMRVSLEEAVEHWKRVASRSLDMI